MYSLLRSRHIQTRRYNDLKYLIEKLLPGSSYNNVRVFHWVGTVLVPKHGTNGRKQTSKTASSATRIVTLNTKNDNKILESGIIVLRLTSLYRAPEINASLDFGPIRLPYK